MKAMKTFWMAMVTVGLLASAPAAVAAQGDWLTDMTKAQEKAKAEQRLILVNFTGSDWCPPCKMMHGEVLTQKEFVDYAKENLVLVEADFPRRTAQSAALKRSNQELLQKHKVRAYPTFLVLDASGQELWRHEGYHPGGPKAFIEEVKKAKDAKRS
jgi:thioredoxin-related protein